MSSPERTSEISGVWLTGKEAADLAHVSIRTLSRAADAGKLEVFTTPGGHRRYLRESVLALNAPTQKAS